MGVPEFSTQIANFNAEQINQIQEAVDEVNAAVNEIKNTDLSAVNSKIGTNADASGTFTIFARLAQIFGNAYSADVHAQLSVSRIGSPADAAGTSNVFAWLSKIYSEMSPIKSIQRGVATVNGSSPIYVNISTINPAKAIINIATVGGQGVSGQVYANIFSSAQIGFGPELSSPCRVSWEVIEYK